MSAPDPLALPPVPPPASDAHPWRDALLAIGFVLALAAPLPGLFGAGESSILPFENRAAAPWPELRLAGRPAEFAAAFERAFADRFGGRGRLIAFHNDVLATGFGVSPVRNVLLGRDGWLYFLGEDGRSLDRHYTGRVAFPQVDIDALARELERRRAFLASRGIAYVVAIVPEKFTIYPEHLPPGIARAERTPLDRAVAALEANPQLVFVDLRPVLREAKLRDRVYYRTDSHWNFLGATAGYDALMRAVAQALPPGRRPPHVKAPRPPFEPGVDVYRGDLVAMLRLPKRYAEDDVASLGKVLADATSRCARRTDRPAPGTPETGRETWVCSQPGLPNAMMLRDSMAIPLIPLIAENFGRTVFLSTRRLDPALVDAERPDIVIEELVERTINAPAAFPMPAPMP